MKSDNIMQLRGKCSALSVADNGDVFTLINNTDIYRVSGEEDQEKLFSVNGVFHSLFYSEETNTLTVSSVEGTLWVYHAQSQTIKDIVIDDRDIVWTRSVNIDSVNNQVVFIGYKKQPARSQVFFVDIENNNINRSIEADNGNLNIVASDISPDACHIAESSKHGIEVSIRNLSDFTLLHVLDLNASFCSEEKRSSWIPVIRYSENGKYLIAGTVQGFFVWDVSGSYIVELCAGVSNLRVVDARIIEDTIHVILAENNIEGVNCWYATYSLTGCLKDKYLMLTHPAGVTSATFTARLSSNGKHAAVVNDNFLSLFEF